MLKGRNYLAFSQMIYDALLYFLESPRKSWCDTNWPKFGRVTEWWFSGNTCYAYTFPSQRNIRSHNAKVENICSKRPAIASLRTRRPLESEIPLSLILFRAWALNSDRNNFISCIQFASFQWSSSQLPLKNRVKLLELCHSLLPLLSWHLLHDSFFFCIATASAVANANSLSTFLQIAVTPPPLRRVRSLHARSFALKRSACVRARFRTHGAFEMCTGRRVKEETRSHFLADESAKGGEEQGRSIN